LVILSQNPLTIDPDEIINIQVLLTMVGGKAEYCTPGFEYLCPDATETVEETQPMVPADIIFFNGQVLTMETDMPQAEALAIKGKDILAVGTNEEILNFRDPDTQVIDLEGRTLMPGFVDAHTHILEDPIQGLNFQSFEEAQQFEFELGITAIGWPGPNPDMMRDFYDNWFQGGGDLRLRVNLYMKINTKCYGLFEESWYLDYPIILDPYETLRIPGIKIYLDPFGGRCPDFGGRNYLLFTEEELTAIITDVQERGYQVAIHVAGEEGIDVALNAIEAALDGQPNTYHHRIEHSTFVKPESVPRYSEVGVVAVCPGYEAFESLGCDFCDKFFAIFPDKPDPDWFRPLRPLLDANPGLCLAWHADWDCYRPVMQHLWGFVTRKRLAEDGVTICEPCEFMTDDALSVEEALRVMTINGARAMRMEEKTGSLKPGKFADLVVLSDNPLTVADLDDILNIQILLTMVGGHVEYCAPGQEALCPLTP
jgi:predicted amidohydrolase YtcJ